MIWAHYILQVNIYLTLFYCFYKLLLSKETYFLFNRVYLVSSGILSLAIPFLRIEWFTRQQAAQQIYLGVEQINTIVQNVNLNNIPDSTQFNWGKLIVLIYLAGVVLFIIRLFFQLALLKRLLGKVTDGQAFSFFNKKVISPELPGADVINQHEDIHIKQLHTVDLIFFELLTIFIWFNPVIYFYKHTIKSIHEYLADEKAADYQGNKEQYALLLLSKAFKIDPHMLTNSFYNKSLIKRRIFMLHKQRSKKTAILKYGLFVPLFALTLVLSSATIRENENIKEVAEDLPIKETIVPAIQTITLSDVKIKGVKIARVYSDPNLDALRKYLSGQVQYPATAMEKEVQGNSLIKFTVENGMVQDLGAGKSLGEGCDAAAMKAILSYNGFKDIPDGKYMIIFQFRLSGSDAEIINNVSETIPGYQKLNDIAITSNRGKSNLTAVVVRGYPTGSKNISNALVVVNDEISDQATLATIDPNQVETVKVLNGVSATTVYGDKGKNGAILLTLKEVPVNSVQGKVYDYVSIETQPTYPGGIDKFRDYISNSVTYPNEAVKAGVQGTVYVNFVVEKDGSLSDINVEKKLGYGLDDEAIRVIRESKKWIPAIKDGKPVRVRYNFPVRFMLKKNND